MMLMAGVEQAAVIVVVGLFGAGLLLLLLHIWMTGSPEQAAKAKYPLLILLGLIIVGGGLGILLPVERSGPTDTTHPPASSSQPPG